MMTAEQLRVSIYQQLFSGKLTRQEKSDGTAKSLLKQIEKVNPNYKKAARIVRKEDGNYYETLGTKETCITDELLFEIPDNWAWVHLNEVAISGLGKTLNKSKDTGETKQYLCSINVYWDGIHLEEIKSARFSKRKNEKYKLQKGDLLICEGGDAGRTAIWDREEEMYYQNALHRVRFFGEVDPYYFRALIEFYKSSGIIDFYCKGMTIKHLVQGSLNAMRFPIPPLAEQKRIVAKIEELMPFVEQYAAASIKLNTLNTTFPDMMKKSILQEAVQGKLVPQDPNDEPASVLLKKIAEEKKRLIKEGKIKKQKPLPAITEEEIPFDIPESWEWVKLESVCGSITDGDHQAPPKEQKGIPFLVISNVSSGNISFSDTRYVSEKYYNSLSEDRKAKVGDILFTVTGSYGIPIKVDTTRDFCFQRHIALIKPLIETDFLKMLLSSPLVKRQCDMSATGTAQKTVGLLSLRNFVIPIPPKEEQQRILNKLFEIGKASVERKKQQML